MASAMEKSTEKAGPAWHIMPQPGQWQPLLSWSQGQSESCESAVFAWCEMALSLEQQDLFDFSWWCFTACSELLEPHAHAVFAEKANTQSKRIKIPNLYFIKCKHKGNNPLGKQFFRVLLFQIRRAKTLPIGFFLGSFYSFWVVIIKALT